jgi:hypothetical protein
MKRIEVEVGFDINGEIEEKKICGVTLRRERAVAAWYAFVSV